MIANLLDVTVAILVLAGSGFTLAASIGLLRLPDLFTRLHAASKAGALGAGLLMLALAVGGGEAAVALRALAGIFFVLLTTPVAAHLLAKAARDAGQQPWSPLPSTGAEGDAAKGEDQPPR